jgi:hypothetical protein
MWESFTLNPEDPRQESYMTDDTLNRVAVARRVTADLVGQSGSLERLSFVIVPDKKADFYAGFLGESTALAKAILGHAVGEDVPYPVGDYQKVHILSVVGVVEADLAGAATQRKAEVQEAIRQAQRMNAMIFATTVEGKWGEYDPDGLDHWE